MNLPYLAADTLEMTLYNVDGKFTAEEIRKLRLGPWLVPLPVTVKSDLINPTMMGLWVTMGALPCYLVVKEKDCWLFALDVEELKALSLNSEQTSVRERVQELKEIVRGMFRWREKDARWTRVVFAETDVK